MSAVAYSTALKSWTPWLRPFVYRFLPEYREVSGQWRDGRKIVQNSMSIYEKQRKSGGSVDSPPSALQYLTEGKYVKHAKNLEEQLLMQMTLAAAGMHTTTASITHILYDLAAHPEYQKDLRAEVKEVLKANNGNFTKLSLGDLMKMDSFMKESQRMSSPDLSKFHHVPPLNNVT
jgi:cytochrome P450